MNMQKTQKLCRLMLCALTSACLPALNIAAQEVSPPDAFDEEYDSWLASYSLTFDTAAEESETENEETADASFSAYTQEELDKMLGNMPCLLFTGSLFLNEWGQLSPLLPTLDSFEIHFFHDTQLVRRPWTWLEETISQQISSYEGDWSVYLKDLATGRTMEINEHSMESASLIKLFIAGAIYEQMDWGNVSEESSVLSALDAMITVSDNESSNVLVRRMCDESGDFQTGLAKVNDFAARNGFTNTKQVNGIADPSLWVSDGSVNMTSPADCGRLLEKIYDRELVSHYNSFRFEVLLNRQEVNYKIPAGLPEGVHISHKTGEVDDTENDAAIIYTPYGDYIFCIMSTDLSDTGSAVDHIHEITRLVYDYFMGYPVHTISDDSMALEDGYSDYYAVPDNSSKERYVLVESSDPGKCYTIAETSAPSERYILVEAAVSEEELEEYNSSASYVIAEHCDSGEVEWVLTDSNTNVLWVSSNEESTSADEDYYN